MVKTLFSQPVDLTGNEPGPNLAMYVAILDGVHGQIRFADTKAAFLSALNALLCGFLATRFDGVLAAYAEGANRNAAFWLAVVLQVLYLSVTGIAVGLIVLSVLPRFSEFAPHGKMFFAQIVRDYGRDYASYVHDTSCLTDEDWAEQMGTQIVEVSHIALTKYRLMKQATWLSIVAFILWRASLAASALLPAVPS